MMYIYVCVLHLEEKIMKRNETGFDWSIQFNQYQQYFLNKKNIPSSKYNSTEKIPNVQEFLKKGKRIWSFYKTVH